MAIQQKTQVPELMFRKGALFRTYGESVLLDPLQNCVKIALVLLGVLATDDDIVQVARCTR